MKISLPWLHSRKNIFILIFIDLILFVICSSKYFYISNLFSILNLSIFILISYIIGKYHINNLRKNKFSLFLILIKNFIAFLIFSLSNFFLLLLFNKEYLIENYTNLLSFISELNILSFIFLSLISRYLRKDFKKYKRIFFIIDSNNYKNLEIFKFNNIIYENEMTDELIEKRIDKQKDLIIIKNIANLPKELFNKIIVLKRNGYSIESFMSYCNKELQYIPSDSINTFLFIESKFFYYKSQFNLRLKRIGDILISFILLILTLPITIFTYFILLIAQGRPIFYSQERSGLNGSTFKLYKFRSMHKNSEPEKALWAAKNDPRITKVGKILRKSRIDELPQLISVIKGDMSLIGPRPERPEIDKVLDLEIKNYFFRYSVKPGISGWAQVNYKYGNSIKDSEIKLGYDFYYIQNYSFWLDLLIFFKTIKLVTNLRGSNPNK